MNNFLIVILSSIIIYYLWNKHYYPLSQTISHGNPDIRISTGVKNGNYTRWMSALEKMYNKKKGKNMGYFYPYTSNGTMDNLQKVDKKDTELAIVQEDLLLKNIDTYKNIRFVGSLYFESIHFMVHHYNDINHKIETFDDMKISKGEIPYIIGTGPKGSGHLENCLMILQSLGFKPKEITEDELSNITETVTLENEILYLPTTIEKGINYFHSNALDGICYTINSKDTVIRNITSTYQTKNQFELVFLEIPYESILYKNYHKVNINTSIYYNEFSKHKLIPTIATRSILVSHKDTSTEIIYLLAFLLYQFNISLFRQIFSDNTLQKHMNNDEISYTRKELPYHKGALQLYKDLGQITQDSKYEKDLNYYAEEVVKYYWKYPKIGNKTFKI